MRSSASASVIGGVAGGSYTRFKELFSKQVKTGDELYWLSD